MEAISWTADSSRKRTLESAERRETAIDGFVHLLARTTVFQLKERDEKERQDWL